MLKRNFSACKSANASFVTPIYTYTYKFTHKTSSADSRKFYISIKFVLLKYFLNMSDKKIFVNKTSVFNKLEKNTSKEAALI